MSYKGGMNNEMMTNNDNVLLIKGTSNSYYLPTDCPRNILIKPIENYSPTYLYLPDYHDNGVGTEIFIYTVINRDLIHPIDIDIVLWAPHDYFWFHYADNNIDDISVEVLNYNKMYKCIYYKDDTDHQHRWIIGHQY